VLSFCIREQFSIFREPFAIKLQKKKLNSAIIERNIKHKKNDLKITAEKESKKFSEIRILGGFLTSRFLFLEIILNDLQILGIF
jgi:hypothetical protein